MKNTFVHIDEKQSIIRDFFVRSQLQTSYDTPGLVCRILLSQYRRGYIYSENNSGGDMYGSYTKNENQTQSV